MTEIFANKTIMTALSIAVIAAMTWLCRLAAIMIFGGKKEIPPTVVYLGKALPPAIMAVLVFYCLKDMELTRYPFGLAEIISVVFAAVVQWKKRNTILTTASATVLYMVLIRTVFKG